MTTFSRKSIARLETLGDKLQRLRMEARLALDDLAQQTGIQPKYLRALEAARYDLLPGDVYVRNFLRAYAEALHVNVDRVYELYEHERAVVKYPGPTARLPQEVQGVRSVNLPRLLRRAAVIGGVLILLVYLGFKVNTILKPPSLQVQSPAQDQVTGDLSILVEGVTESEAAVAINGQEVFTDPSGKFSERIDLQPGLNVIKISSHKGRSREQIVYRQVIVEEPAGG